MTCMYLFLAALRSPAKSTSSGEGVHGDMSGTDVSCLKISLNTHFVSLSCNLFVFLTVILNFSFVVNCGLLPSAKICNVGFYAIIYYYFGNDCLSKRFFTCSRRGCAKERY